MADARLALARDLPLLEVALAEAFRQDPMVAWVIGGDDEDRRVDAAAAGFFRPAIAAGLLKGHTYVVDGPEGGLAGGAVWAPPDVPMLGDLDVERFVTGITEFGTEGALERIAALGAMVEDLHPHDQPHFYLFILGATEKGQGVGGRLLAPVLDRCDRDRLPAYLESSSARNISFYERCGFRVVWEEAPEGGPVFRGMWRDPR